MATPEPITLRSPSRYTSPPKNKTFTPPPLDFLCRTWAVSHSTLSMWRSAQNVRITYRPLPASPKGNRERVDDLVEYEGLNTSAKKVKSVAGIDTAEQAGDGSVWTWRGKGLLALVSSHWELLGWGERVRPDGSSERWMVSWFAATLFTSEGLDILTDRREGPSQETVDAVLNALAGLEAKSVADLVANDMRPVAINLPWTER
ncbi:hypothetical protein QBC47DRAFT_369001 [Echria macrotheca]|uniref:Uncharacterized protein n=1 Tax=Echria macrotheca TaxID=438768 RepID=A0AAJ0FBF9_9PEZI|nr:hypothetical protein QBC47DRAFT_369001 [Echria macrotheca]